MKKSTTKFLSILLITAAFSATTSLPAFGRQVTVAGQGAVRVSVHYDVGRWDEQLSLLSEKLCKIAPQSISKPASFVSQMIGSLFFRGAPSNQAFSALSQERDLLDELRCINQQLLPLRSLERHHVRRIKRLFTDVVSNCSGTQKTLVS